MLDATKLYWYSSYIRQQFKMEDNQEAYFVTHVTDTDEPFFFNAATFLMLSPRQLSLFKAGHT